MCIQFSHLFFFSSQTSEVDDAVEDTWIVSGQSTVQQELLEKHPPGEPIKVKTFSLIEILKILYKVMLINVSLFINCDFLRVLKQGCNTILANDIATFGLTHDL